MVKLCDQTDEPAPDGMAPIYKKRRYSDNDQPV